MEAEGMMIEESLKSAQFAQRLVLIICATLLFFAISTRTPINEYRQALEEFDRMEGALEEVTRLHGVRVNEFYRDQGLIDVLREGFSGTNTADLNIVGVRSDYGQPMNLSQKCLTC